MSHSPQGTSNPNPNSITPSLPLKKNQAQSLPDSWFNEKSVKDVVWKMNLIRSLSNTPSASPPSEPDLSLMTGLHSLALDTPGPDQISHLPDELLLRIFSKLPISQCLSNSLVCKRWLGLHGRLVESLKLADWSFISSGRIFQRFPNLTDIDIVRGCIKMPRNSSIVVSHKNFSVHVDTRFLPTGFIQVKDMLSTDVVDKGLEMIGKGYPNLKRLAAIGASENGILSIAGKCEMLQELELHCCGDLPLTGLSGCRNLQVVKLIGCVDGFYNSVVSDIGLTILAQGCRRLVKLELCGCEGSYDGIKAIGQCCQMLEELILSDHRMDGGWLSALSFCGNLKTLKLQSCNGIDLSPGPEEHLWSCPALEELHLQHCQMRDKQGVKALFLVCEAVREIVLQNCWGLDDEVFGFANVCRRVKLLSLEGCSLLTTEGLGLVILNWKELQSLRVISCNSLKDGEVTSELASLFSVLKELKWRPDSRSLLSSSLAGTGMGIKGGRFFKRVKA